MTIKKKLELYLKDNLIVEKNTYIRAKTNTTPLADFCAMEDVNDYIKDNKEEETFQTKLFKYIDDKNLKDNDVYNKVNIDRRLFSKIRSNKNYHPSKETIILLGISLELTEKELEDLLDSASYSLPMNTTFDLIIRFCFKEKIYDLNQINDFLYDHDCKLLNI